MKIINTTGVVVVVVFLFLIFYENTKIGIPNSSKWLPLVKEIVNEIE